MRDAPRLSIGEAFLRRANLFDRFGLRAPSLVELIDGANGAGVELRLKKSRHFWNDGETRDPIPRLPELPGDISLLLPCFEPPHDEVSDFSGGKICPSSNDLRQAGLRFIGGRGSPDD